MNSAFDAQARHDLLEILEERYGRRSTIITSQLSVADWHSLIGHATYTDAILDRLVHNAQRIELKGESLRRTGPHKKILDQNGKSTPIKATDRDVRSGRN